MGTMSLVPQVARAVRVCPRRGQHRRQARHRRVPSRSARRASRWVGLPRDAPSRAPAWRVLGTEEAAGRGSPRTITGRHARRRGLTSMRTLEAHLGDVLRTPQSWVTAALRRRAAAPGTAPTSSPSGRQNAASARPMPPPPRGDASSPRPTTSSAPPAPPARGAGEITLNRTPSPHAHALLLPGACSLSPTSCCCARPGSPPFQTRQRSASAEDVRRQRLPRRNPKARSPCSASTTGRCSPRAPRSSSTSPTRTPPAKLAPPAGTMEPPPAGGSTSSPAASSTGLLAAVREGHPGRLQAHRDERLLSRPRRRPRARGQSFLLGEQFTVADAVPVRGHQLAGLRRFRHPRFASPGLPRPRRRSGPPCRRDGRRRSTSA